jgi:hypothetical protein
VRPLRRTLLTIGAALLLLGLLVALVALRSRASTPATPTAISATTGCQGFPQFAPRQGFTGGVILDTSLPDRMGLVLRDPAQPGRGFQHPTWDDAGNLGPFAVDPEGNIYVAPTPKISLAENPVAGANTIWRVDTTSAVMTPWLTLPAAAPPSARNPFGILGLAYDCATRTLYAASVAGSGPTSAVGRIVQIDVARRTVISQRDGIDAMGLVVAATPEGRRLFYGSAREHRVFSLALDAGGACVGEPRPELDLATLGGDAQEKARRIDLRDDRLDVTVVPFTFTLAPKVSRHLYARYDRAAQAWVRADAPTGTPAP